MIGIVPMKRHSQRVPDKNIRDFHGHPLYWRIFNTLYSVDLEAVILTTDSEELAVMVRNDFPMTRIMMRPPELCGDHITANSLIGDVISRTEGNHFLYTHVTNPLLRPETIRGAMWEYGMLMDHDALMGVTRREGRFYRGNGSPINHDPYVILPTQSVDPIYEDNSCLYLFSRKAFLLGGRVGERPYFFQIGKIESIDIDTEEDFRMAERMWEDA